MKKVQKLIVLFSVVILVVASSFTNKSMTFEEKMRLSGVSPCIDEYYEYIPHYHEWSEIKSFDDFERLKVNDQWGYNGFKSAIVKVKCKKVEHFLTQFNDEPEFLTITHNTIYIEEIFKVYEQDDLFKPGTELKYTESYGYQLDYENWEELKNYFKKEHNVTDIDNMHITEETYYPIDLNSQYKFFLYWIDFENSIIPLDEGEEYIAVITVGENLKVNVICIPYNKEKYRDVFDNKCNFRFTGDFLNACDIIFNEFAGENV